MEHVISVNELYSHLRSPIGIKNSPLYEIISNMNISESDTQVVSNGIHNFYKERGEEAAFKKVLDIMRVNPMLAIKILRSCALCKYTDEVYLAIKDLVYALSPWNSDIILNNKMPFTITLVEALYMNGSKTDVAVAEHVLKYIQSEDKQLYNQGKKVKYLTPYNIRHIFRNIPSYRQIEFLHLFWQQHCYASKFYSKFDSYSSRCIDIMLREMKNKSLWEHFENKDMALSEQERQEMEQEMQAVRLFIETVLQNEGKHLPYIKAILGKENLIKKFEAIMGCHPSNMGFADLEKSIEECEIEIQKRKQQRTEAHLKRAGNTPENHKKPYKKPYKKSPQ